MTTNLFLVFSNPTEGLEEQYNSWYDEVHLRDVCAVPGVASAQRYELAPATLGDEATSTPPAHRYLAVYELDGEPEEVFKELTTRVADGRMPLDESLDMATVAMTVWRPRGKRVT